MQTRENVRKFLEIPYSWWLRKYTVILTREKTANTEVNMYEGTKAVHVTPRKTILTFGLARPFGRSPKNYRNKNTVTRDECAIKYVCIYI